MCKREGLYRSYVRGKVCSILVDGQNGNRGFFVWWLENDRTFGRLSSIRRNRQERYWHAYDVHSLGIVLLDLRCGHRFPG
jgi:hypothetical protein